MTDEAIKPTSFTAKDQKCLSQTQHYRETIESSEIVTTNETDTITKSSQGKHELALYEMEQEYSLYLNLPYLCLMLPLEWLLIILQITMHTRPDDLNKVNFTLLFVLQTEAMVIFKWVQHLKQSMTNIYKWT